MKEFVYGFTELPEHSGMTLREAVKGIILCENNKILLIQTNKGDYKFVGGGIQNGESDEDALRREILEESGFEMTAMGECLCMTTECSMDRYEKGKIFRMVSRYYICEIDACKKHETNLDDYEKEQDFQSCWVDIDAAIQHNRTILETGSEDINPWVRRDTDVLCFLSCTADHP